MVRLTFLSLVMFFLVSCSQEPSVKLHKLHGQTMGTSYNVSVVVEDDKSIDTAKLQAAIDQSLSGIDRAMSTYKSDSEVSRFNDSLTGESTSISNISSIVIRQAIELNLFSQGALDITVGPLVDLWGFGGGSKNSPKELVPSKQLELARSKVGMHRFQLRSNQLTKLSDVRIDLSAIAKGFAVDQVARVLDRFGLSRYLVEIGGEIVTSGKSIRNSSWVLGIESPDKLGRNVYTMVYLDKAALATSGDYRNYFERDGKRYSHTIDPATGSPVTHNLASVSVIADDCMVADGLATALMVMGELKGFEFAKANDISAFFIFRDGEGLSTKHTKNFEQYLK